MATGGVDGDGGPRVYREPFATPYNTIGVSDNTYNSQPGGRNTANPLLGPEITGPSGTPSDQRVGRQEYLRTSDGRLIQAIGSDQDPAIVQRYESYDGGSKYYIRANTVNIYNGGNAAFDAYGQRIAGLSNPGWSPSWGAQPPRWNDGVNGRPVDYGPYAVAGNTPYYGYDRPVITSGPNTYFQNRVDGLTDALTALDVGSNAFANIYGAIHGGRGRFYGGNWGGNQWGWNGGSQWGGGNDWRRWASFQTGPAYMNMNYGWQNPSAYSWQNPGAYSWQNPSVYPPGYVASGYPDTVSSTRNTAFVNRQDGFTDTITTVDALATDASMIMGALNMGRRHSSYGGNQWNNYYMQNGNAQHQRNYAMWLANRGWG